MRAEIGGITIIDDFAHHPTAIRETLRALRSVYPQSRLWAVLEPRSNTLRRKVLEADLVESLRLADRVVLAGVYQQQRIPDAERLHPEDVVRALNAAGTQAELCPMWKPSSTRIAPQLQSGDVVAILSNGGFDGIYEKLPARLQERFRNRRRSRKTAHDRCSHFAGHDGRSGIPVGLALHSLGADHGQRAAALQRQRFCIVRSGSAHGAGFACDVEGLENMSRRHARASSWPTTSPTSTRRR